MFRVDFETSGMWPVSYYSLLASPVADAPSPCAKVYLTRRVVVSTAGISLPDAVRESTVQATMAIESLKMQFESATFGETFF